MKEKGLKIENDEREKLRIRKKTVESSIQIALFFDTSNGLGSCPLSSPFSHIMYADAYDCLFLCVYRVCDIEFSLNKFVGLDSLADADRATICSLL